MASVPGFNNRDLKRREWQNGSTWHWRYYFRVPIFLPCELRAARPDPPANLHEWVVAAHQKSRTYRANPVRPTICGLQGGRIQAIADCTPNKLEYGDVVSLVFTLHYVEDRDDWGPVTMLSHIVRVQHANKDIYRLSLPAPVPDIEVDDVGLQPGTIIDGLSLLLSATVLWANVCYQLTRQRRPTLSRLQVVRAFSLSRRHRWCHRRLREKTLLLRR